LYGIFSWHLFPPFIASLSCFKQALFLKNCQNIILVAALIFMSRQYYYYESSLRRTLVHYLKTEKETAQTIPLFSFLYLQLNPSVAAQRDAVHAVRRKDDAMKNYCRVNKKATL